MKYDTSLGEMKKYKKIDEISAILFLGKIKGFGPIKFKGVYEKFGTFAGVLDFLVKSKERIIDLQKFQEIIGENIWSELFQFLNDEQLTECKLKAEKIFQRANEIGGHLITYFDEWYPQSLYQTNQCIPIIYAIGNKDILKETKFSAVVGTRKPCSWTIKETKKLVRNLVKDGYVIVSGLARGIDTISHETALDSNGKTIAVVGCGPDVCYPPENRELYEWIKRSGLIISEYPFGTKVSSLSLKKRNKIIVGLSKVVFITETSVTGGTMNSYLAALEQKKPVKVFLPISNVGGNFTGNLKIYNDSKIYVEKISVEDPNLDKLRGIKAILFDLDGTLWDSKEALCLSIYCLLRENNVEFKEKEIERLIRQGVSPLRILKSYGVFEMNRFWALYRKNYSKINLFLDSEKEILSQIKNSGKIIAIVTSLKRDIALELLRRFDLNALISSIISSSDTRARKPSPIPIQKSIKALKLPAEKVIYIGDTDDDIIAAKNAGCLSGIAAWNKFVFISRMPDFIFTKFEDLLHILGEPTCTTSTE